MGYSCPTTGQEWSMILHDTYTQGAWPSTKARSTPSTPPLHITSLLYIFLSIACSSLLVAVTEYQQNGSFCVRCYVLQPRHYCFLFSMLVSYFVCLPLQTARECLVCEQDVSSLAPHTITPISTRPASRSPSYYCIFLFSLM